MSDSAKFCSECGSALREEIKKSPLKSKPAPPPFKETLMIVGVVAVITVGYFIFSKPQQVPVPPTQVADGHGEMGDMGVTMPALPDDYDGLVLTGDQYMNQNNFPIAAECYKRALAIDDSSPDVRSDFGSCLYGMGLIERALEEFRTVKKNNPLHSVSLFNLGVVFYTQNVTDSAKFYFTHYLELEPDGKAAEQAQTYLNELGI